MADRIHFLDNGNTRITASTGRIWFFDYYRSWRMSMRREVRTPGVVWWRPASWFTRASWRTEGTPPNFAFFFLDRDGEPIPNEILQPNIRQVDGLTRVSIMYAATTSFQDLGNDARSVSNVRMEYDIQGERFILSHR